MWLNVEELLDSFEKTEGILVPKGFIHEFINSFGACVYLSGSEFQFLVTFTFVRPNILDSFV